MPRHVAENITPAVGATIDGTDLSEHRHTGTDGTQKIAYGDVAAVPVTVIGEVPVESPDGIITNFSTGAIFKSGKLSVYKNGLRMLGGVGNDYTEDADCNGYTFADAPLTGDIIQHDYVEG